MPKKKPDGAVILHPYEAIAKRMHKIKFVVLFCLIAFLLGGLLVLRGEFTAENFRYLIKDLDLSTPALGQGSAGISFDYDTSLSAALYRGDLAFLRRSALEIHSFSGEKTLSEQVSFSNPVLVPSERYLLAYDLGGTRVSVYNSFSALWHETYDYAVFCADAADNGAFAVVTSEKGYHSALYVYNSDFEKVYRWCSADKLVMDVSFCDENPNLIALSCVRAADGGFLSEVLLFDLRRAEVKQTLRFTGQMPLELHYETEERLCLLCDTALYLCDLESGAVREEHYGADELACFYTGEGYTVLLRNSGIIGTALDITVFYPGREEKTYDFSIPTQIADVKIAEDNLYLLSYETLYVLKLQSQTLSTHHVESEFREVLTLDSGRLAFVGEGTVSVYMVG